MVVTDIYGIPVASMKLGVACPIPNEGFRFWDDAGTWIVPSNWTNEGGNLTLSRTWVDFDDQRAMLKAQAVTIPDDQTFNVKSLAQRYFHANDNDLAVTQDFYWSFSAAWNLGTGAAPKAVVKMSIGTDSAMGTKTDANLQIFTGPSTSETLRLTTGTQTGLVVSPGYDWFQFWFLIRDTASGFFELDNAGVMFNPFDGSEALTLTNVFPVNGPVFTPESFVQLVRTPLGTVRQFDRSGGARRYMLQFEIRNESQTVYKNLRRFWNLNKGMPGIAPYPLLLEPNIPGVQPTMEVNFVGNNFPIRRQVSRVERYSGVLTFETFY